MDTLYELGTALLHGTLLVLWDFLTDTFFGQILFAGILLGTLFALCCITYVPVGQFAAIKRKNGKFRILNGGDIYFTPFQFLHTFAWRHPFGYKHQLVKYKFIKQAHTIRRKFLTQNETVTMQIKLKMGFMINSAIIYNDDPFGNLNEAIIQTSDEFFKDWTMPIDLHFDENACKRSPYGKVLNERLAKLIFPKLVLLEIKVDKPESF